MLELPDVENYARYLKRRALHKSICDVTIGSARILRGVSAKKIKQALKGNRFERTRRHGKHLLVALDHEGWLAMHFGMTGRLKYFKDLQDDPKHDRLASTSAMAIISPSKINASLAACSWSTMRTASSPRKN